MLSLEIANSSIGHGGTSAFFKNMARSKGKRGERWYHSFGKVKRIYILFQKYGGRYFGK